MLLGILAPEAENKKTNFKQTHNNLPIPIINNPIYTISAFILWIIL
jgi:hypothetical protein